MVLKPCTCSIPIGVHGLPGAHMLPLLTGLFGLTAYSAARLTLCGVDESFGLHSLHLVSSLGWVLLGYRPFLDRKSVV